MRVLVKYRFDLWKPSSGLSNDKLGLFLCRPLKTLRLLRLLIRKILQHSLGSTYATNSCLQRYYIVSNSARFLMSALLRLKVENIQIEVRTLTFVSTRTEISECAHLNL